VTVNDAIVAATARLVDSSSPALDAQVLLAHVLDRERTFVIAHARDELDRDAESRFAELVEKRASGTPVAYLTGLQEFWSLPVRVNTATLIPRPETELLVELALEKISPKEDVLVADLCTGSGAIALAIASERKHVNIYASDISADALEVAIQNAERLHLPNIKFSQGSVFEPLAGLRFQVIVSNPPYVAEDDPHMVQGDVRFEPRDALAAGVDGLDVITQITESATRYLEPGGWLLLEHGHDQEAAIEKLFIAVGLKEVECYRDLAGLPRVTLGQFPG